MAMNLLMLAVTLLMAAFFLVWLCFPRSRSLFEAPKYRVLDWDKASRPADQGKPAASDASC